MERVSERAREREGGWEEERASLCVRARRKSVAVNVKNTEVLSDLILLLLLLIIITNELKEFGLNSGRFHY